MLNSFIEVLGLLLIGGFLGFFIQAQQKFVEAQNKYIKVQDVLIKGLEAELEKLKTGKEEKK